MGKKVRTLYSVLLSSFTLWAGLCLEQSFPLVRDSGLVDSFVRYVGADITDAKAERSTSLENAQDSTGLDLTQNRKKGGTPDEAQKVIKNYSTFTTSGVNESCPVIKKEDATRLYLSLNYVACAPGTSQHRWPRNRYTESKEEKRD